ncbi:carboxylating nicotinate-nucleotide diphosphorylase [Aquisalinus flavus]|uniref:Probable nicotinate-nucleotide pyrophosphorylase [carboxylating] n=1 Tax=Aquisalinus flavus TaxID=1526572 RepID=A0A8J2V7G9_9PROT|nr:carboxylating nicotinate-nucleotide diphosphorylase [Aquisalinus flavus]MBD0426505.1 carboxylating nicotinate-nucleotide diphosphorylase [Aquisalinus flavus]UNE47943.1 carboxylating nicotinate-nucleotide diphosphorylase [Aquisalinus flavus]GGD07424.1 nicotinate-nucleotide diphosphorylase (carboxylating) [Aquisalinus flavus]
MARFPLPRPLVETHVRAALVEDLGDAGDITTLATIPAHAQANAVIAARKPGIIAGTALAEAAFTLVNRALTVEIVTEDGGRVEPGTEIIRLSGPARAILTAERVALNYLGHLSGIATATADLVRAVDGTGALIVCTRKTTPGLRALEKHAVKCGGGQNHRFGLYDAVMIKDNHIAAAGSIAEALQAAKAATGHMVKIEIEVDTIDQLGEVLEEGADVILLDNMSTDDMRKAVEMTAGRSILEASGNVTIETVRAIAETGVDVISSGWITHSAPALDLGLDWA